MHLVGILFPHINDDARSKSHQICNFWLYASFIVAGVEFGARMITIDGKQIKLQIWDTVSIAELWLYDCKADELGKNSCPVLDNRTLVLSCGAVWCHISLMQRVDVLFHVWHEFGTSDRSFLTHFVRLVFRSINHLTPNGHYMGRTAS